MKGSPTPCQVLLIALAAATLSQGVVYSVKEGQERTFLRHKLLPDANKEQNELEALGKSLAVAFDLPSHKSPQFDPGYGLVNPMYRLFGPPASTIAARGGHCGRRARLLIALLHSQGIRARKIFLINGNFAPYGHRNEYVHAVVEVQIGDEWIAPAATPTSPTCGRVNFLHPASDGTAAF